VAVIGELIEWLRTTDDEAEIAEGRFDLGGGDLATCVDYQPSGHDSQPMPGDFALLAPGPESGSYLVAGWVDPNNAGVTKPGEARLYARDGEGAVVGALHVTADGNVPDGIAAELIARADRADDALNALASAFNSHTHNYLNHTGDPGSDVPALTGSPATDTAGTEPIEQDTEHAVGCDRVYVS
jgi:hypothetical protein